VTQPPASVHDVVVDAGLLTIGEFARRSRLSLKALRLYERLGLLSPAMIDPANGYRRYREDQLAVARLIVGLRRLDMPLSEVARVITTSDAARSAEVLQDYWAGIERRLASQRELADRLLDNLRSGGSGSAVVSVQERDVPEVIVISEKRAVELPELRSVVSGAIARLSSRCAAHGGAADGPMIMFHGEVNEDSDGPVEVCIPVRAGSSATRCEPAHREVYVAVTKQQWDWPSILSVYDALDDWVRRHGRRTGPPREIYHSGFNPTGSAADDLVCEVAFPIE